MSNFRNLWLFFLNIALVSPLLLAGNSDNLIRYQNARSRRVSSAHEDWRDTNKDAKPIPPGKTVTIADIKGPGIIRHIWFTVSSSDPKYARGMIIRMYWDDSDEPAVECPFGDFFAIGHGITNKDLNSEPVTISSVGRAYNCYWSMPFKKRARITITNDSGNFNGLFWYIDYDEVPHLPDNTVYFHAQYRQEYPAKMGQDYLILDTAGRGHYVGTVLSVQLRLPQWFGEGDDRFFVDGEENPSLAGTGTEDYFCDAWGFREFNRPYYGVSVMEGEEVGDRITAYRWHIHDPVHFNKSLKVTIEHKGRMFDETGKKISNFHERPDLFSSVAFWYQNGRAKRFATIPPYQQRLVPTTQIEFEDYTKQAVAQPAGTQIQIKHGPFSARKQLSATFKDRPQSLTVPFTIDKEVKGYSRFQITKDANYGIWKISLDGKVLPGMEALDLYSPQRTPIELKLGAIELSKGKHQLQLEYVGKNANSTGEQISLDGMTIEEITRYSVTKSAQQDKK